MEFFDSLFGRKPSLVTYHSEVPRTPEVAHPAVNLQQVEFLVPEQVMSVNVSVDDLGSLIEATERSLRHTLADSSRGFDLRVRFTIYTDRPVGIDLGSNVQIEPAELRPTYAALNAMPEAGLRAKIMPVGLYAFFEVKRQVGK